MESLPGCEDQSQQFRDEVSRPIVSLPDSLELALTRLAPFSPLPLQQIDGRAFLLLTQRDIVRIMSIKLGPALKIYNCILMFKYAQDRSQSEAQDRNQSDTQDRSQSEAQTNTDQYKPNSESKD